MIISGCAMNFKQPIWDVSFNTMSASTIVYLIFGIIAGTALAFYLFIDSLKYLSPKETTLLGTIEPVIAVVTSALWLDVTFQSIQVVGIVLILILILMLSLKKQPEEI